MAGLAKLVNEGTSGTPINFSGKTITVTATIDLSAHYWIPIGKSAAITFNGTFTATAPYVEIKNLTVDKTVTPFDNASGLFGNARSATISKIHLTDIMIKGRGNDVGGIVGFIDGGSITNCYVDGSIPNYVSSADAGSTGGLVGYMYGGTVSDCASSVDIALSSFVGGIVGECNSATSITRCYNLGEISGGAPAGGIVGLNTGLISECFNNGIINVNARETGVGGIAGDSEGGSILNCYNAGEVNNVTYTNLGGIVGRNGNSTIVMGCYNLQKNMIHPISSNNYPSMVYNNYWLAYSTDMATGARSFEDMSGPNAKSNMPGLNNANWTASADAEKDDDNYYVHYLQLTSLVGTGTTGTDSKTSVQTTISKDIPIVTVTGTYEYMYGEQLSKHTVTKSSSGTDGTIAWTQPRFLRNLLQVTAPARFTPTDTIHFKTLTNIPVPITVSPPAQVGTYVFDANTTINGQTILQPLPNNTPGRWSWYGPNINTPLNTTYTTTQLWFQPSGTSDSPFTIDISFTVSLIDPVVAVDGGYPYSVNYGSTFTSTVHKTSGSTAGALVGNGALISDPDQTTVFATFTPTDGTVYKTVYGIPVTNINVFLPAQTGVYVFPSGTTLGDKPNSENPQVGAVHGTYNWGNPTTQLLPGDTQWDLIFTPDEAEHKPFTMRANISVSEKIAPVVNLAPGTYEFNYGDLLSTQSVRLGEGSTPGTITWNGTYANNVYWIQMSATFTPTDAATYATTTVSVPVEIRAPVQDGDAYVFTAGGMLEDETINQSLPGGVAGRWDWQLQSNQLKITDTSFYIIFWPEDTVAYVMFAIEVVVRVDPAPSTVNVTGTYGFTYGDALSKIGEITHEQTDTRGTITWKDPTALLDAVGTYDVDATFTPTDLNTYAVKTVKVSVTVTGPSAQRYTYDVGDKLYSKNPPERGSIGGISGTYAWKTSDKTFTAVGSDSAEFLFTPDGEYIATDVPVTITVSKGTPDVTMKKNEFVYGTTLTGSMLDFDSSVPGSMVLGNTTILGSIGKISVSATFVPSDATNYNDVTLVVSVDVIRPSQNGTYQYEIGGALSEIDPDEIVPVGDIDGTYAWVNPSLAVDGDFWADMEFTPTSSSYQKFTMQIWVTVNQMEPTVNVTGTYEFVYGDALSTISEITHASTDTAGTITWFDDTVLVGKVGSYNVDARFTPDDTTMYKWITVKVPVTVAKPATKMAYTYEFGDMLYSPGPSGTVVVGGIDGAYSWSSPDEILDTPGETTRVVRFTPALDAYEVFIVDVKVVVGKETPIVTPEIAHTTYGTMVRNVNVTFDSSTPGEMIWDDDTVILGEVAGVTLGAKFVPVDTVNYKTVEISVTISVSKPPSVPYVYECGDMLHSKDPPAPGKIGEVSGTYSWKSSDRKFTSVGSETAELTFTPSENYRPTVVDVTVTVNKGTPKVTMNENEFMYGTTINGSSLDCESSVGGTIVLDDTTVVLGTAGTMTLGARFIPTDTVNYNDVELSVKVTVTVPEQEGTYTYDVGQTLSDIAPDETTPVEGIDGTYAWVNPSLAVDGDFWADMEFTPTSSSYDKFTIQVWVTVNQMEPTVNVTGTYGFGYGDALSTVSEITHASTDTPGTITWFDDSVLVGRVGSYTIDAKFTPDDTSTYKWVTVKVPVVVSEPVSDTIYVYDVNDTLYSQDPRETTPVGGIDGTYGWDVPDEILDVSGETFRAVRFTPSSPLYDEFVIDVRLVVGKAVPTVDVEGATAVYGTALSAIDVDFTSSTPGSIVWDDGSYVLGKTGDVVVDARFVPNDTTLYESVDVTVTVTVTKPSQAGTYDYKVGMKLSDIAVKQTTPVGGIAGTFAWADGTEVLDSEGTFNRNIVFTPTDTTKYEGFTMSVSVTVTAEPAPAPGGDSTMIIVAVVAIIAVVAVVAVYFLFLKPKQ